MPVSGNERRRIPTTSTGERGSEAPQRPTRIPLNPEFDPTTH